MSLTDFSESGVITFDLQLASIYHFNILCAVFKENSVQKEFVSDSQTPHSIYKENSIIYPR